MKLGVLGLISLVGTGVAAPAFAQTPGEAPAPAADPALAPAPVAEPAPAPVAEPVAPVAPVAEVAPGVEEKPAVERTANNALYVELLGASLFYSLNYDRRFGDLAVRAGLMYFSVSSGTNSEGESASVSWVGVPLSVMYNIGSIKHSFEVGAGITIHHFGGAVNTLGVESSDSATEVLGHAILGYRYQPPQTGFFLRAGLSPVVGSGIFLPWPHVGLGATF
jgi:hypothetical protein